MSSASAYIPRRVLEAARAAGFLKDDGTPNAAAYLAHAESLIAPKKVRVPRYSPSRASSRPKKSSIKVRRITQKPTFASRRKSIRISTPRSRNRSRSRSRRSTSRSAVNEEHPKHVDPFNHGSDERGSRPSIHVNTQEHLQTVRRKLLEKLLVERMALNISGDNDIITELATKPKLLVEDERLIRKELNRIHSMNNSSNSSN